MAHQYYKLIDGVPCVIESAIPQLCTTTDVQNYQIAYMQDVNNGINGQQYFYTTQNSEVLQHQQIFVEGQLHQGSFDQSQNVYFIKAEDFNLSQDRVKTEYLQQVQANEVISVNEENIKQPVSGFIHGQQIHVISMPENNSRSQQATMKTPQARPSLKRAPSNYVPSDEQGTSEKKCRTVPKLKPKTAPFRLKTSGPTVPMPRLVPSPRAPIHQNNPSSSSSSSSSSTSLLLQQQQQHRQTTAKQIECLSERIKQNKLSAGNSNNSPVLNDALQKQRVQKSQLSTPQKQPTKTMQQPVTIHHTTPEKNNRLININNSDIDTSPEQSPEKSINSDASLTDCETSNNSESYAYLQKAIENPQTTIVQHQIEGNTVKMLVVMANGEQRLITFDIPNEECTVHDLLEQAGIPFNGSTTVSLVKDPILKINYIVESEAGTIVDSTETIDPTGGLINDDDNNVQDDDNISRINIEEPRYVDGKLAICNHCNFSSMDFHRCYRCKLKLTDNIKMVSYKCTEQQRKEMVVSIENYYKKTFCNNTNDDALTRQRGRPKTTKTKLIKEPECLTLSSDDDDDNNGDNGCMDNKRKSHKSDSNKMLGTSVGKCKSLHEGYDVISEKEPIITDSSSNSTVSSSLSPVDTIINNTNNDLKQIDDEMTMKKQQTSLLCRTVRIGSYKYIPKDDIIINSSGLTLSVPLLEDDTTYAKIHIKFQNIIKVLIHFAKSMPVLFFYTNTITGSEIRDVLGMQDTKGPYYDPAGKDQTHKRITLLPEKLSEDSKLILKQLFLPNKLLEELNTKEANDILIRASPKNPTNNQTANTGRRGTTIGAANNINNQSMTNGIIVENMTVYPPPPAKGGITITTDDYSCLGEDQFLNDVIIDFYLKYLTLEVLKKEDQDRTHVFSSYFYKRLTSPHAQTGGDSSKLLTPAAKRHARVSKWTKNVNIFDKDYIIIPINEHSHWFLAIICYPGLVGTVDPSISHKNKPTTTTTQNNNNNKKQQPQQKELHLQTMTIGSTTITPVTAKTTTITLDQQDDGSERDEAEGDDDELDMESDYDDENNDKQQERHQQQQQQHHHQQEEEQQENNNDKLNDSLNHSGDDNEQVKIPCILIFDSLGGAGRSRVVATLRDYLSCEYSAKIGDNKVFSKDTIKGACPKVPQQSNFTDCGLYVLQYVESFFENPILNYTIPIKHLKNWFDEIIVTKKREDLSILLVKLMKKTNGDKQINVPIVQFPTMDGKLKPRPEKVTDDDAAAAAAVATVGGKKVNNDNDKISNDRQQREPGEISPRRLATATTVYTIVGSSSGGGGVGSNSIEIDVKPKLVPANASYLRTKRIQRLNVTEPNNQNGPVKKTKE